ncbi:MAG: GNAT family N-acetyltransferase [Mesonia sp.]|uniref:GNAT family N-acetyltransferase n=1 Tax=Mesonia sp. TaxID=1960830 RepID=UPI003F96B435
MKLRKASDSDLELTYRIKCNSIKPYVKRIWGWDEEYQRAIHKQKFVASETQLIKYNGKEIGLIIVKESANEIFLQNILIEKNLQNMGIGRQIMERIMEKANFERKPIRLQVFRINLKAQRFIKDLAL